MPTYLEKLTELRDAALDRAAAINTRLSDLDPESEFLARPNVAGPVTTDNLGLRAQLQREYEFEIQTAQELEDLINTAGGPYIRRSRGVV